MCGTHESTVSDDDTGAGGQGPETVCFSGSNFFRLRQRRVIRGCICKQFNCTFAYP